MARKRLNRGAAGFWSCIGRRPAARMEWRARGAVRGMKDAISEVVNLGEVGLIVVV